MKTIDLKLQIDGLLLKNDETVEDYVRKIQSMTESAYNIQYEILYEEEYGPDSS